jgi:hypothetical protein
VSEERDGVYALDRRRRLIVQRAAAKAARDALDALTAAAKARAVVNADTDRADRDCDRGTQAMEGHGRD